LADTVRFRAVIQSAYGDRSGGGALAVIPADVAPALGSPRQHRVIGTLNGLPIKSSTMTYGGIYYVGVHKATREAAGVTFGDTVDMELAVDNSARVLELAPELESAFAAEPELRARFDALAFTRRKEMADPIRDAVKPETRAARLEKALAALRDLG
jgi:uncharacterized protein DUF1905/bacteriocin resistance YdeI/OmpD-like protein